MNRKTHQSALPVGADGNPPATDSARRLNERVFAPTNEKVVAKAQSRAGRFGGRKTCGREAGLSLVTVALILLFLSAALMVGMHFLRALLPVDVAIRQKEALLWADKAILGFASIHHRLPCPEGSPGSGEDCALAKGYLPASALDLDATMFAPGLLPMRYMVYSNPALAVATDPRTHRSLTRSEMVAGLPDPLPLNAYGPLGWDRTATNTLTDIKDNDTHPGRFTARGTEDARNGLDMCETLRLIRTSLGSAGNTYNNQFAHYQRNSAPVNVAYGIAVPGEGSISGTSPFEGDNASAAPQMEAPDRPHGAEYNDQVFVRDLPSLMTAFGCAPILYAVQETLANPPLMIGAQPDADLPADLKDRVKDILAASSSTGDPDALDVISASGYPANIAYDREGISVPIQASAQSVALAANLAKDLAAQRARLAEEARIVINNATIRRDIATAGIGLSSVFLAGGGVGIDRVADSVSPSTVLCSKGLCASEQEAIDRYIQSIGMSGNLTAATLNLNREAVKQLIAGAQKAGMALDALGGSGVVEIQDFCRGIDVGNARINFNQLLAQVNAASAKSSSAKTAAEKTVEQNVVAINQCINGLQTATLSCSIGGSCDFATTYSQYIAFLAQRENLYKSLYYAEREFAAYQAQIDINNQIKAATCIVNPGVSGQINTERINYANRMLSGRMSNNAELQNEVDRYKTQLEADYADKCSEADRKAQAAQQRQNLVDVNTPKRALANAIAQLTPPPNVTCPSPPFTLQCQSRFFLLCAGAEALKIDMDCGGERKNTGYCHWIDAESKKALHAKIEPLANNLASYVGTWPSPDPNLGCTAQPGAPLNLWPETDAEAFVRQVDKRSILQ